MASIPRKGTHFQILDLIVLVAVAAAIAYVVYRVNSVLDYHWNWAIIPNYILRWDAETESWVPNLFLRGMIITMRLALWGTVIATIIGLVIGLSRCSQNLFLRLVSRAYVELIRNIPPLVFIFIFYFFLSSQIMPLLGVDMFVHHGSPAAQAVVGVLFADPSLLANFVSGVLCLGLFEGAYIAEIVRAGVQSIERGQWEAAKSIGLSRLDVMRFVILPQAIQKILPPLAGQFITLIKDSAIVSLISIQELTFMAMEVAASTTKVFETWITVGAMYFGICFIFAVLFGRLEKRMSASRR